MNIRVDLFCLSTILFDVCRIYGTIYGSNIFFHSSISFHFFLISFSAVCYELRLSKILIAKSLKKAG